MTKWNLTHKQRIADHENRIGTLEVDVIHAADVLYKQEVAINGVFKRLAALESAKPKAAAGVPVAPGDKVIPKIMWDGLLDDYANALRGIMPSNVREFTSEVCNAIIASVKERVTAAKVAEFGVRNTALEASWQLCEREKADLERQLKELDATRPHYVPVLMSAAIDGEPGEWVKQSELDELRRNDELLAWFVANSTRRPAFGVLHVRGADWRDGRTLLQVAADAIAADKAEKGVGDDEASGT